MKVLVVTPIPSHPQDQGNSARIYVLTRALAEMGVRIVFVYVGMERDDVIALDAMADCWDDFHFVEATRRKFFRGVRTPRLDDFYEERLTDRLEQLFKAERFDAVLVNYVWISKCFEAVPAGCLKILDTHDVFGDRHERLLEDGIAPQWFFTSREEEEKGIRRADLVLGIQPEESKYFSDFQGPDVITLGHLMPDNFGGRRSPVAGRRLRLGFFASGNPSNVRAINIFAAELDQRRLESRYEFVLAGAICNAAEVRAPNFDRLGLLDAPEMFYDHIDVCLNPHVGGTGLKIKSVEALSYGKPLVATVDAMTGIASCHREHRCRSPEDMAELLCQELDLDTMRKNTQAVFLQYFHQTRQSLATLVEKIEQRA